MISHKHKCIFIHIPKTGGTSIENFFQNKEENPRSKHKTAQNYALKNRRAWNKYFKFTVVRNPWDWMVSWYFWRNKNNELSMKEFLLNYKIVSSETQIRCLPNKMNFLEFVNIDHTMSLDYVCKFENLQEDFRVICEKIGIPHQELPHVNKTNHKHYTKYYDDETRQIVAEKYAKDIEYFGYKFGE
jgi:hypothetical protein